MNHTDYIVRVSHDDLDIDADDIRDALFMEAGVDVKVKRLDYKQLSQSAIDELQKAILSC